MKVDYLDAVSIAEINFNRSLRLDKSLKINILDNATLSFMEIEQGVMTLEVLDNKGQLLPYVNPNLQYGVTVESNENVSNSEDIDVVYLGCIWNCWGHFFTDGLAKAWYLLTDEYKEKYKGKVKIAISFINNTLQSCPKPLLSLYQLFGVDEEDIILITQPTKFRSVIVPDNSLFFHNNTRHFTKEYTATIDAITNAVPSNPDRKFEKIYLSRTHFTKGNADFGERSLEAVFKRIGYTIIHPQEYSVLE